MKYEIYILNLYIITVKFILNSNMHKNFILKSKILSCAYNLYFFLY